MMKLLLVDDDSFLREMYAVKFGEVGFDVHSSDSAAHALQELSNNPDIEVVLVDVVMPGMGGIELITEIKTRFPDRKLCVIVLSNQGQESDISSAMQAGAAGYIIKAEAIPTEIAERVSVIVEQFKAS